MTEKPNRPAADNFCLRMLLSSVAARNYDSTLTARAASGRKPRWSDCMLFHRPVLRLGTALALRPEGVWSLHSGSMEKSEVRRVFFGTATRAFVVALISLAFAVGLSVWVSRGTLGTTATYRIGPGFASSVDGHIISSYGIPVLSAGLPGLPATIDSSTSSSSLTTIDSRGCAPAKLGLLTKSYAVVMVDNVIVCLPQAAPNTPVSAGESVGDITLAAVTVGNTVGQSFGSWNEIRITVSSTDWLTFLKVAAIPLFFGFTWLGLGAWLRPLEARGSAK